MVAVWLVGFAAVRAGSPEERDPYWQIRAGLENLDGTPLARPDSWSWAPVDGLFYPNSPGWNVLLGLAWRAGGDWGLFLLSFALLAGFLGLTYLVARRLGARPLPALAGIVATIILAFPLLNARATLAVQVLLLLGLVAPDLWRPLAHRFSIVGNVAVAAGAGALLSVVGNWTHLSWITLAPMMTLAWAVYWLSQRRATPDAVTGGRLGGLLLGGTVGLLIGPLVSPYGLATGIERTLETQEIAQGLVVEWVAPFTPGLSPQWVISALAAAGLAVVVTVWLVRGLSRGGRRHHALVASLASIGIPFAVAGLLGVRFLGLALLTLAPVTAWGATRLVDRAQLAATGASHPTLGDTMRRWTSGHAWRVVLTTVAIVLLPGVVLLGPLAHARPAEAGAVATLPSGCRLFSTMGVAAVTILTRPDIPVWIDGRVDYYGRQRMLEAIAYSTGQAPTAAPPGTTCVLLPAPESRSSSPRATARMQGEPGWDYRGRVNGFDVWVR